MPHRRANKLGRRGVTESLTVLIWPANAAFGEAAQPALSPTNIFAPVSTPAHSIFGLSVFVLGVTAAIFVTVFTLLAYAVVKYRKRADDDGREPPQIYGSNQVELAWTVIPVLIVVVLFMATCSSDCRHSAALSCRPTRWKSSPSVTSTGGSFAIRA